MSAATEDYNTEFRKYSSIENSYQDWYLKRIISNGLHKECDWLVFEKIDGSNFSFVYNGVEMKFARRGAILGKDERFFDYTGVAERYSQAVIDLYHRLGLSEGSHVNVFGELYGGYYPMIQSAEKPINKNIFYCPQIDFIVFDVFVKEPNDGYGKWLPYDEYAKLLENIPVLEPLFRGSFEDALKFENEFVTKIPVMHGLPEIEDNLAEGVVIKPAIPLHFPSGARVALKNKIERYNEKQTPKKPVAAVAENPILSHPINDYINPQRLDAVISKIGYVTKKDFSRVMKEFSADILEDYRKDHEGEIDDKEEKILKKVVGTMARNVVSKYFA